MGKLKTVWKEFNLNRLLFERSLLEKLYVRDENSYMDFIHGQFAEATEFDEGDDSEYDDF